LRASDSIVFGARFQERVLSRIADHHLGDVWFQQVVQQAALVPSWRVKAYLEWGAFL
jgi:hypothetical protein